MIKIISFLLSTWILVSCNYSSSQNIYIEIYETVWNRVNENFYSPDFNGKDWSKIKSKYKPIIENVSSDDEFFDQLNNMLFELESSHFAIGPISGIEEAGSPYMFKEGSIGIDIRFIDNEVVVTKIEQNSPAALAGLKLGTILKMVDGEQIDTIINSAWLHPPNNEHCIKMSQTEEVLRRIYGQAGTSVMIKFLDGNELKEVKINRYNRIDNRIPINDLLGVYLEVEEREIEPEIGYLRFNAFQPDNPVRILNALERSKKYKGLIVDLRGNNGGSVVAMQSIIGNLISKRFNCFTLVGRETREDYFIEPSKNPYQGQLVILVDEMSVSGAENMAQILKNSDRAIVVGSQTSGQLLWGDGSLIKDSIVLVIPTYQLIYPNGLSLEGKGVAPNEEIKLSIEALNNDKDTQLDEAVNQVKNQLL